MADRAWAIELRGIEPIGDGERHGTPFESFLQVLADGLAGWSAVFLMDMLLRRGYDPKGLAETGPAGRYYYSGGVSWAAVIAWLAGILVGLAFTVTPWFSGPFARGIFATSSLGYLIGFAVSALLYLALQRAIGRALPARASQARIGA